MRALSSLVLVVLTVALQAVAASPSRADESWRSEYLSISEYSDDPYRIGETYRVLVDDLRPTQFSIGMAEVRYRREKIDGMSKAELRAYLKERSGRVVIGPGEEFWMIDGHHLARALQLEEKPEMLVKVVADWSRLSQPEFFRRMVAANRLWLYDETGQGPLDPRSLPKSLRGLRDDPYRSLAWQVKRAGGYDKSNAPFAEFRWAEFLRQHISREELRRRPKASLEKAVKLAHSPEAKDLPGYRSVCERYLRSATRI